MSQTYSIGCHQCRKEMWIAQGSYSELKRGHLYAAHAKHIFEFLIEHKGHPLTFDQNCDGAFDGFQEIEAETGLPLSADGEEQPAPNP